MCLYAKETSHYWLRVDGEILSPVTLSLQLSASIGLRFEFLPQIQCGKPQDEACLLKVFQICHIPEYRGDKKAVPYWRKVSTTKTLIPRDYTQPCMGLPSKVTKLALKLEAWKLLLQLIWWQVLIWTVRRLFEFFFFTIYSLSIQKRIDIREAIYKDGDWELSRIDKAFKCSDGESIVDFKQDK